MAVVDNKRIMFCETTARKFAKAFADYSSYSVGPRKEVTVHESVYKGHTVIIVTTPNGDELMEYIMKIRKGEIVCN